MMLTYFSIFSFLNGCPYAGNIFTIKNSVTVHVIILH
jgi:hypothetical protein